jgi:hypothetical protein
VNVRDAAAFLVVEVRHSMQEIDHFGETRVDSRRWVQESDRIWPGVVANIHLVQLSPASGQAQVRELPRAFDPISNLQHA